MSPLFLYSDYIIASFSTKINILVVYDALSIPAPKIFFYNTLKQPADILRAGTIVFTVPVALPAFNSPAWNTVLFSEFYL